MRQAPPPKRAGRPRRARRINGEILSVDSAAELLGVTPKVVRARIARGQLPYRRWGTGAGRIILLKSEILKYLERLPGLTAEQALAQVPRSPMYP
ncbi:MAG: helix-turn-helix domain-containing protein [candidate division NC10 bacterium]|nr:helix-turn-helix domain-containing protein [candidate division NC10 bacterium]